MSLSKVTSTFKRSVHNYLVLYYRNQLCRTCFNECFVHRAKAYCSYTKKIDVYSNHNENNEFNSVNNHEIRTRYPRQEFNKGDHKLLSPKELKYHLLPKNSTKETTPNLVGILINLYETVNHEFNKKHMSFEYNYNKDRTVKCTIKVSWPEEMSFSHEEKNKKGAAYHAAWKCIYWLYFQKRIKLKPSVKPVLYSNDEINALMKEPIKINLESKHISKMEALIDTYNNNVKPIVGTQSSSDVSTTPLMVNKDTYYTMSQLESEIEFRNKLLEDRLRNRVVVNEDLPISNYRTEIVESLENNRVLLIKGDTGCGKSTQVPQFIMDSYIQKHKANQCNIIMSEPRRISAISLANRVASERDENVGDVVGYQVRLHKVLPKMAGSILFCTTGVLLKRIQSNPTLEGVSHVIIDEAHERNLSIDILLNLLKKIINENQSLQLIIMSATINAELFQQYFSCPVINVPGKMYPVKMHFIEDIVPFAQNVPVQHKTLQEPEIPYKELVTLIKWIIFNKPPGAILCFLPGWREISYLQKLLQNEDIDNLLTLPLHSKLTWESQKQIFDPVATNVKKVILATDIAESSITIKDVVYVVDSALKREKVWIVDKNLYRIGTTWISQANINQRQGRAGRIQPGESYHLITKDTYDKLNLYPTPEICKTSLEQTIIIGKTYKNTGNAMEFFNNMIEQPDEMSVFHALENLEKLCIIDQNENLTPLGKRVMHFTLDPRLSVAVIYGCVFQCLNPILSIASLYSTDTDLSTTSLTAKSYLRSRKMEFHKTSDHIAALYYFQQQRDHLKDPKLSVSQYIFQSQKNRDFYTLERIIELYANEVINSGMIQNAFDCTSSNMFNPNHEMIRAVLFVGANQLVSLKPFGFKNGCFSKHANMLRNENNEKVLLSNDSVNYKRKKWPSPLLVYLNQVQQNHMSTVSDTSMLSPLTVLLFNRNDVFSKELQSDSDNNENDILIGIYNISNVKFSMDKKSAEVLLNFRNILWSTVDYIVQYENVNDKGTDLQSVKQFRGELIDFVNQMLSEFSNGIDDDLSGSVDSSDVQSEDIN